MGKKVLLVGNNDYSIIIKSLQEYLAKSEYEVEFVRPQLFEISTERAVPNMILLYMTEELLEYKDVFGEISDYCIENDIRVGIIGYPEEMECAEKQINSRLIWRKFVRPFNAVELVTCLDVEIDLRSTGEEKKSILIIDDSEVQLKLIQSWLEEKYKVATVSSAAMAISFLTKSKPDLILLDYEMPVCSGPQFMEMVQNEDSTKNIPIIFLTSVSDKESVQNVISLKPAGYLLKTMAPAQIIKYVDDFFKNQMK